MEHIVQFAIGIDDEGIRKHITESGEKQIIDRLYGDCKTALIGKAERCWGWNDSREDRFEIALKDLVFKAVDKIVTENKDEIIDNAAKIIADRIGRTKAAKATLKTVVESDVSEK